MEREEEGRERFEVLKRELLDTHLAERWSTAEDLGTKVFAALMHHIRDDEDAGRERPRWYRGPEARSDLAEEVARLSIENAELRARDGQQASRFESQAAMFAARQAPNLADNGILEPELALRVADEEWSFLRLLRHVAPLLAASHYVPWAEEVIGYFRMFDFVEAETDGDGFVLSARGREFLGWLSLLSASEFEALDHR